jgi:hypothetical protein
MSAPVAHAQDRGGFTLLGTLGYGLQSNGVITVYDYYYYGEPRTYGGGTYSSWAGLNLGIGGFIAKDTALMLRFSGTSFTAKYIDEYRAEKETDVVSGVMVLGVQHWIQDRFNVEAGAGLGIFSTGKNDDESGLGLMLGGAWSFYQHKKLSLQLGIEDAVFAGDTTVNSLGFCFGVQLL